MLSNKTLLHLASIIVLGLIAYSNALNSPFQFDDTVYIKENILVSNPSALFSPLSASSRPLDGNVKQTIFTRYLGHLSFAVNYWMGDFEVKGYRATNLAIHLINALLVYWFVLLSFRTPHLRNSGLRESSGLIALFSALLFVAHPVQTQAVTYISQRFTSLCAMFYLLSLALYIKARLSDGKRGLAFYLLSFMSTLMAMFTKEISFTLTVAIAIYELMFFESVLKSRAKRLLPYLLIMPTVPLLISVTDFGMFPGRKLIDILTRITAGTTQTEITSWEYFLTQLRIMPTYLRLLFLPVNQTLDYDYAVYDTFLDVNVFISFVFLVSIAGLGVVLLRRFARAEPLLRLVSFGIFWFFITLSVESSFIVLADVIFEHRLYLPSMALLPAFVGGVFYATEKLSSKKTFVTLAVCVVVVISLAIASHERNEVWQTKTGLWEDVVIKSPNKWRGHYNLGNEYQEAGLTEKAVGQYKEAIGLNPEDARAYYNLGNSYKKLGLNDLALEQYRSTLKRDPNNAKAYNNIGNIYLGRKLYDRALEQYRQAITLKPSYGDVHYNMGIAYYFKGDLGKAVEQYSASLAISPNDAEVHHNLGIAYRDSGETDMARKEFEEALRIDPDLLEARRALLSLADPEAGAGGKR